MLLQIEGKIAACANDYLLQSVNGSMVLHSLRTAFCGTLVAGCAHCTVAACAGALHFARSSARCSLRFRCSFRERVAGDGYVRVCVCVCIRVYLH